MDYLQYCFIDPINPDSFSSTGWMDVQYATDGREDNLKTSIVKALTTAISSFWPATLLGW